MQSKNGRMPWCDGGGGGYEGEETIVQVCAMMLGRHEGGNTFVQVEGGSRGLSYCSDVRESTGSRCASAFETISQAISLCIPPTITDQQATKRF